MMRRIAFAVALVAIVAVAAPTLALNPGTDVFVPAAVRGTPWVTDMYIFNPGSSTANVAIYWLPRDSDNSGATPVNMTVNAGETAVLDDVILNTFGSSSAAGAFRVMSDVDVAVNCRIYSTDGSTTFGQGFEGVPATSAVAAGGMTDILGLAQNTAFRSNFFAINTGSTTASITFDLMDPSNNQLASRTYTLQPYAAFYRNITDLGGPSFDNGTLHAEVTQGSAIVVGSKVDNASGDPTTLEAWWSCGSGGGTVGGDGIYVGYMSYNYYGGFWVVVENNAITYAEGSYVLFSPDDGGFGCGGVYGWSFQPATPIAIAGDGTFSFNFDLNYSSETHTLTFNGTLSEDTLLGTIGIVSVGTGCVGTMNSVPFYAGHTLLTLQ